MSQALSLRARRKKVLGWIGVAAIALAYIVLYAVNLWLPLTNSNYTSRIWHWSQLALTAAAVVVVALHLRRVTPRAVVLGLSLAVLSTLSHALHNPSWSWSLQEGLGVWVCFLGGLVLFQEPSARRVAAFTPPFASISRNLAVGAAPAVPLAIINNLYFYVTLGARPFENGLYAAIAALSPAIHEEIVFRYFVLALCFRLLRNSASHRLVMVVALFLAVVPHSLNHLPDLFLQSPGAALFLLLATSLLFGLPMALLQVKRSLESAIAFHWLIDFARFVFGW